MCDENFGARSNVVPVFRPNLGFILISHMCPNKVYQVASGHYPSARSRVAGTWAHRVGVSEVLCAAASWFWLGQWTHVC